MNQRKEGGFVCNSTRLMQNNKSVVFASMFYAYFRSRVQFKK